MSTVGPGGPEWALGPQTAARSEERKAKALPDVRKTAHQRGIVNPCQIDGLDQERILLRSVAFNQRVSQHFHPAWGLGPEIQRWPQHCRQQCGKDYSLSVFDIGEDFPEQAK